MFTKREAVLDGEVVLVELDEHGDHRDGTAHNVRLEVGEELEAPGLVSRTSGAVRAYWSSDALFPARSLASGWYVYAVRFAASMNPSRTALFVGTPFRAG